ncbi:hypothetical protein BaRGS_00004323 [Batillaria attramentaria]|uniref:Uncharacterized protein n=1 Tax=Batillaria attramentaria TaxID=370345 RepID=A0ABD0LYE2_9CAEN
MHRNSMLGYGNVTNKRRVAYDCLTLHSRETSRRDTKSVRGNPRHVIVKLEHASWANADAKFLHRVLRSGLFYCRQAVSENDETTTELSG